MKAQRKRNRRLIAGVVSTVALLMTSAAVVQLKTSSSWRKMMDTHKALRAGWLAAPGTRAPLWGETHEGEAHAHYEKAAEVMADLVASNAPLVDLINKSDEEVAAMAGDLREAWQPALAELQAGAHASHGRIASELPDPADALHLINYRWVSNAAAFETRYLRRAGDDMASVRMTLDSLSMAADICNDGLLIHQMMGVAFTAIAIEPWTDDALRELDPAAATVLANGLAKLDAQLPKILNTDRELLFLTESLQSQSTQNEWMPSSSWRYGFSARWMIADAVLLASINYNRMHNVGDLDWNARQRMWNKIEVEVTESGNDVATLMYPNMLSCEKSLRHSLGKVRLLRMALDRHRGVESEALADPFGSGPLLVEESTDNVTLRSVSGAGFEPLEFVMQR